MTDFRALYFELLEWAEFSTSHYYKKPDVIIRARAALAEQPVGPTDEGIIEMMPQQMCDDLAAAARALARFHQGSDLRSRSVHRIILNRHAVDHARAVLARWGQPYKLPTTQPIPVSERLPQAKDCDAENQCWWFSTETETQWSKWTYFRGTGAESHWLSAHAIPLPIKPEAQ